MGVSFLEAIADAVERFDHLEVVVHQLELLAQPLDVAVDGAVVHIDLVVIGGVHQGVAALDHAGPGRQRLKDQEFGDGEDDRLVLPGAGVALRVHLELAAFEDFRLGFLLRRRLLGIGAAQDRLDPLDQQALGEGFADEIVGAHLQAEQFVDLLVLGGEEDHRQVGLLAQPTQQFHSVHARHLDVEDRHVGRIGLQPVQRGHAVGIGLDAIALALQSNGDRGENIAIVVDEGDGRHDKPLFDPKALKITAP